MDHPESFAASLGVVSFLNSRPLIHGLDAERGMSLCFDVPSRLPGALQRGEVDAALVPVVGMARAGSAVEIVSDACIGADGDTMTVRVFSRVPPEEVTCIHTDTDSMTSVVLAQLIWSRWYEQPVRVRPMQPESADGAQALLLIGDKVITAAPDDFEFQIDLGAAWKEWTSLPFVFAVWTGRAGAVDPRLGPVLSAARDRGVADAVQIAHEQGPARGWPGEMAEAYLTKHMKYVLTDRMREGMARFLREAEAAGLLPASRAVTQ